MQDFGNFSSLQKGFEGYLGLLKSNFPDAYSALTNDSKTIIDFANGLQNGTVGAYATDPNYSNSLQNMLKGVIIDYSKDLNSKMSSNQSEINKLQIQMKGATDAQTQKDIQENINKLKDQNNNLRDKLKDLDKFKDKEKKKDDDK
jgi:hypothetical protein